MRRFDVWLSFGFAAAMFVACGGKSKSGASSNPSSNDHKDKSCEELCQLAEACDAETADCQVSCAENESVSNAGQEAVSTCFADLPCEPAEADLLDALLCVTDELEDSELSEQQETFCSETSKHVQACTGNEPDNSLGDCGSQIGLVSDELLSDINQCDNQDCDKLQNCVSLQLLQGLDLSALASVGGGEDISAGAFSDLLAALVLGSQLGIDEGTLPGAGGAFP